MKAFIISSVFFAVAACKTADSNSSLREVPDGWTCDDVSLSLRESVFVDAREHMSIAFQKDGKTALYRVIAEFPGLGTDAQVANFDVTEKSRGICRVTFTLLNRKESYIVKAEDGLKTMLAEKGNMRLIRKNDPMKWFAPKNGITGLKCEEAGLYMQSHIFSDDKGTMSVEFAAGGKTAFVLINAEAGGPGADAEIAQVSGSKGVGSNCIVKLSLDNGRKREFIFVTDSLEGFSSLQAEGGMVLKRRTSPVRQ